MKMSGADATMQMDKGAKSSPSAFQANPAPVFPTLGKIDPRLPPKEQIWGFNVDDDYVAITESFVREAPKGVRNLEVGGEPIVASYDAEAVSLGILRRPSAKRIKNTVDVHGRIGGKDEGKTPYR